MNEKPAIDVAAIVEVMKREITSDIEAGIVPSTVRDFSELHDYVDANMYADEELLKYEEATGKEWLDYINAVQDQVHAWLQAGRPNVPSIEDQGYDPSHDDWTDTSYCPACGSAIDHCQGHGSIGDPVGAMILARHDNGDHRDCVYAGCVDAGQYTVSLVKVDLDN